MPYVQDYTRGQINHNLQRVIDDLAALGDEDLDGNLNYVISRIVAQSINRLGNGNPEGTNIWRYNQIARAVAVFECAKLEFYRRVAAPKEDIAIHANGDIPEYDRS